MMERWADCVILLYKRKRYFRVMERFEIKPKYCRLDSGALLNQCCSIPDKKNYDLMSYFFIESSTYSLHLTVRLKSILTDWFII